ncbi:hypothetical protein [Paenibacillus sp. DMB20]|nr:hypothetical protein [Paenibacillus sp. DMB20]
MNAPSNPGLSQKAWKNMHRLIVELNEKYKVEIASNRQEKGAVQNGKKSA